MCQAYNRQYKTNFISAIPTNTYGPYDNFEEEGHVIAGLIKKFHQAKIKNGVVKIWGTGKPKREFLYVNDVADACIFLMNKYNENEVINIAGGKEISIRQLIDFLKVITGFKGKIIYDTKRPDGIPKRLLSSAKISKIGWRPKIDLKKGIELTYQWYQKKYGKKLGTN
jgi:GDP-L-fucose synthase